MQWISLYTALLCSAVSDQPFAVVDPPPTFPIFTIHIEKNGDVLRVGIDSKHSLTTVRAEEVETECTENYLWFSFKKVEKFSVKIDIAKEEQSSKKPHVHILVDQEGPAPQIAIFLPKESVYLLFFGKNKDTATRPDKKKKPDRK